MAEVTKRYLNFVYLLNVASDSSRLKSLKRTASRKVDKSVGTKSEKIERTDLKASVPPSPSPDSKPDMLKPALRRTRSRAKSMSVR